MVCRKRFVVRSTKGEHTNAPAFYDLLFQISSHIVPASQH